MMTPEERAEAQALYRGAKDKTLQLAIIAQMYPAATQAELNDALGTTMTDWPKKRDVPAHKKTHKWTSGEVYRLRRMAEDGCSNQDIADALGIPESAVKSKRKKLGVQLNHPSEDAHEPAKYTSRRNPDLERLIYRAFLLVDDLAVERGLPIETEWRCVLGMLEQTIVDLLPTVWAHPDTEDYVIQIAALSASDDWKKKTASPGGNPNEAKGK